MSFSQDRTLIVKTLSGAEIANCSPKSISSSQACLLLPSSLVIGCGCMMDSHKRMRLDTDDDGALGGKAKAQDERRSCP